MECYYIVISSAHLSNGHFRNIKGVFRGPLSKNGNKTLDYAEKENTIAKALEDLKANFYCELCDKQYYKHQEFDNHINSYDHAHKQRLKELKHREFARNVASKSRKDERKQEKALQRLHKLAELRKETSCAPGSGPMFKSTTVTVRDNCNEISQNAVVDSSNKQQDFNSTLMYKAQNTKDIASIASSTSESTSSNASDTNKLGNQIHGAQGHKVGFSFAFPKKASVKLESSAAVFYEYNDETSFEHGVSRRSRFVPGSCNLQSPSTTEMVLCSEEKHNDIHSLMEKCTDTAEAAEFQEPKELASNENTTLENTEMLPAVSHLEQSMYSGLNGYCTDINSTAFPDTTPPTATICNQELPIECNTSDLLGNKSTAFVVTENNLSLHDITEENKEGINSNSSKAENEIKKLGSNVLISSNYEGSSAALQNKSDSYKRSCEPFVPVLSKHGSTILQWPSEMLIYTNTEPSVSYSCNPLYFDFKSSKSTNSLEKSKHELNVPHSHHKTESDRSLVWDYADKSISELADCETEMCKNVGNHASSIKTDGVSTKSYDSEKQVKLCLDNSFRIGETEKYHISRRNSRQDTAIDEGQNKGWIKEPCEKWFRKNRKRRGRRKLCHHHHGKTGKAVDEISLTAGQEINYLKENKLQPLQNAPNMCKSEISSMWLASEEMQQSCQKPGIENSDHKRVMFTAAHIHEHRGTCAIWNTTNSNDHCTDFKHLHRKYKASSHKCSKKLTLNSRRHNLMYSRTFCGWRVKRSTCSPDHKCLGQYNKEKCTSQSQSIKRAYNFLTDEPERSHRKRRQQTYSCSSDESSYKQTFLSQECLNQMSNLTVPCKPKGKRRRKKNRIHHAFVDRELKRNENYRPLKDSSTVNILGELLIQDNIEQTKSQPIMDYAKDKDQIMQLGENNLPLQADSLHSVEKDKSTECFGMESTPNAFLEDATHSASSVSDHCVQTTATQENKLEEEKKHENITVHETQAPYKVPNIDRNVEQTPPKSYLCHYEVAETVPQEKINEATSEWLRYNSGIFNSPPPLPFKEAHINSHTFLATEQILTPFTLPDQTLIFPQENHEKFKDLQCEAYQQIMQQNMLANKMKFTFPSPAIQPSNSPLQPLPLQQPLCSTSVTTIHHTVLQQHAAAAAAAASTFKVLQPHQQFLSQVPALSRTPVPHLSVGPRLCPGGHTTFIAPPHLPLIPTSVLHPSHLAFPPLPHALFPSLLSPHPAVIPLQPLF
ncbi:PREDICTED: zinc finger protein 804A [Crocodylus porosus]|uniref:zinc finger protein 804A n=1 Tax=Crocodylus porosus TaxID=8502 RepID=UPI00093F9A2A|nr:PREDICTED: zinc finger protein 804A [Crocodylus porosus]